MSAIIYLLAFIIDFTLYHYHHGNIVVFNYIVTLFLALLYFKLTKWFNLFSNYLLLLFWLINQIICHSNRIK